MSDREAAIREEALSWRAWATGERKKPPHNLLAFITDVERLLDELAAAREREAKLREALRSARDCIARMAAWEGET